MRVAHVDLGQLKTMLEVDETHTKDVKRKKSKNADDKEEEHVSLVERDRTVTLSDSQKDDMTMEDSADQSEYLWVRFDLIFGSFVFINGLTLGYQIDSAGNEKSPCISIYTLYEEISFSRGVSDAAFWYLVENFFLVIFTSEWFLRWAIFAESKFEMDVPLMLGFLPAMPEDGTPGSMFVLTPN